MKQFMKTTAIALLGVCGLAASGLALSGPGQDSARKGQAAAGAQDIVSTAVTNGNFKTLAAALTAADLVPALQGKGPFTVFAPTDAAFEKVGAETISTLLLPENKEKLQGLLKYHVVAGEMMASDVTRSTGAVTLNGQRVAFMGKDRSWYVDNAKITTTDIRCSNGVIHVIDAVIMPSDKDIVETAVENKFNTLARLLVAAGWAEPLKGEVPFTVFAPTDEAFAKIDKATLDSLLLPENKAKLESILKYHVVPGRVYSPDAIKAGSAATAQGSSLTIKTDAKGVMINNARVISADIDASNGVIHVVDTVLMPK